MNGENRLERVLPAVLEDLGAGPAPDYSDIILARTVAMSQRPGWVFPEGWFPMSAVSERLTAAPRLPWRAIGVLALLLLALATAVLIVGTQQHRLPAPYGPASNGLVAFARDGDIFLGDPATGDERPITTSLEVETAAFFSRDGTRLMIFREAGAGPGADILIANVDGSDLFKLTDSPLVEVSGGDWSGDGRWVVMSSAIDGRSVLTMFDLSTRESRILDVGMVADSPTFRPPDGAELLFQGHSRDGDGIFVVEADGSSAPRRIVGPTTGLQVPQWSPDGKRLAYSQYVDASGRVFTHIVGADGNRNVTLDNPPGVIYQVVYGGPGSVWSPDGKSILVGRSYAEGPAPVPAVVPPGTAGAHVLTILSADGSVPDRELKLSDFSFGSGFGWAPDGTQVVSSAADGSFLVFDLETGTETTYDGWSSQAWQRVVPRP